MIKLQTSHENNILLFTEQQNEKAKIENKQKLYNKKNITYKNRKKKEDEREEKGNISFSQKNKINKNKKNYSKNKENHIKSINSKEINKKEKEKEKENEMGKSQKMNNKFKRKIDHLKIFNPNQTNDNLCITDRLSNINEDNMYLTTMSTPKKSFKNNIKNILNQTYLNIIKTPKYSISLLKDNNKKNNNFFQNRNKRIKSMDIREFYTQKNSDLSLTNSKYEYDFIRKYSGKPNFIIKEIEEPSNLKENQISDILNNGLKTERNRSFNDSFLKEFNNSLSNYNTHIETIKNMKSNNTSFFWEPIKKNKEFDLFNNHKLYNSSQKNLNCLRKRNKYNNKNNPFNIYNSFLKSKERQSYINLNRTFYNSKSNFKNPNIRLNSTFYEMKNIPLKYNNKKNKLIVDLKRKNKSLAPILENEKFHYLEGTICTKNKIVKKIKNNFDDYPMLRKIYTLVDKNEIKGKEKYKNDKSKKIMNKYNASPTKKSETKLKLNNITVKKNSNNIINLKNNNKLKKYSIKNRTSSMDNSISNISSLSSTHLFNGKIEDYLITKELGKGSYAVVKLAKHKITNEKYAIKIYTKESLLDPQKRNTVKNEINILKQLNHINIMKLYEVIDSSKYLYLVLEYINGMSLLDLIKIEKYHYIEEHRAIKLFLQIVKGISYCQSKNINHRDIKLENILVIKDDIIKIIDFGFAVKGNKDTYQKLFCGTPSYMSPEIVNKEKYIAQYSDVWSLGILLYAMLYGRFPFKAKDDKKLFELINKAEIKFPENIFVSENTKNLLKKILNVEPKLRLNPEEIINEIIYGE